MKEGTVPGVVPFIPVLKTLLTGEPVPHIRCGSGMDGFAVMTSGCVEVCPVAPELPLVITAKPSIPEPHRM